MQCIIRFFCNFFFGVAFTLLAPMVLASTNSNSLVFGTVQSAGAIGAVVGGVPARILKAPPGDQGADVPLTDPPR